MSNRKRINVNVTDQTYRVLVDLSGKTDQPYSAVIKDALGMYRWFLEARAQGNRILVELPGGGGTRELISL